MSQALDERASAARAGRQVRPIRRLFLSPIFRAARAMDARHMVGYGERAACRPHDLPGVVVVGRARWSAWAHRACSLERLDAPEHAYLRNVFMMQCDAMLTLRCNVMHVMCGELGHRIRQECC